MADLPDRRGRRRVGGFDRQVQREAAQGQDRARSDQGHSTVRATQAHDDLGRSAAQGAPTARRTQREVVRLRTRSRDPDRVPADDRHARAADPRLPPGPGARGRPTTRSRRRGPLHSRDIDVAGGFRRVPRRGRRLRRRLRRSRARSPASQAVRLLPGRARGTRPGAQTDQRRRRRRGHAGRAAGRLQEGPRRARRHHRRPAGGGRTSRTADSRGARARLGLIRDPGSEGRGWAR
ncbi:hypothetical protein GTC6_20345 [Gordonia terrae C-6]|uniref:Uncharacterized protein n=1 Tax=Gordonia terrae C-6 TaxID=1316928 RepID=R7Y480_9ACTN|nr:hypothetical protein GTC6_20345 [Gordonia terrae C-6]